VCCDLYKLAFYFYIEKPAQIYPIVRDLTSSYALVRLIQEEKQNTEARAEELESRVGSLEHMNLLVRGRSFERSSPPLSGRSTPKSHLSPQRDYLHKYHTVSSIPLSVFLTTIALDFSWLT